MKLFLDLGNQYSLLQYSNSSVSNNAGSIVRSDNFWNILIHLCSFFPQIYVLGLGDIVKLCVRGLLGEIAAVFVVLCVFFQVGIPCGPMPEKE